MVGLEIENKKPVSSSQAFKYITNLSFDQFEYRLYC